MRGSFLVPPLKWRQMLLWTVAVCHRDKKTNLLVVSDSFLTSTDVIYCLCTVLCGVQTGTFQLMAPTAQNGVCLGPYVSPIIWHGYTLRHRLCVVPKYSWGLRIPGAGENEQRFKSPCKLQLQAAWESLITHGIIMVQWIIIVFAAKGKAWHNGSRK